MKTTHYIYNMGEHNFLKQSVRQMRKSIKGIDDSYNHPWDILAELAQNSVDAVRKRYKAGEIDKGVITLTIDCRNNFISIEDNGVGIDPDKLQELLAPFSTDKEEDPDSVGEKGVGLTFTIFSCNDFYIKTGTTKGAADGKITDAFKWKTEKDNIPLFFYDNPIVENYRGTLIKLGQVSKSILFDLSLAQLKAVLRTKTAFGNSLSIWGDDIPIDIFLNLIDIDGDEHKEKINFNYLLVTEGRQKNAIMDIEDWYAFAIPGRSDIEKIKKIAGKVIYKKGVYLHNQRPIKYWACIVPTRRVFNEVSVKNGICTVDQLKNQDFLEQKGFTLFQPALTVSVKGMPTGITIEPPVGWEQGRWPQIFMIFEDPQIKFDIGRKSIHGMQAKIYKNAASDIFSDFVNNVARYMGNADDPVKPEWDKFKIFDEIALLPSIEVDDIRLQKKPENQEASVAGLFYECIGNRKIKDILPLSSGYKRRYDLYALYRDRKGIIEFKADIKGVIDDFINEKKYFNQLDCVVCWNVKAEDSVFFTKNGLTLEEIEGRGNDNNIFPHATHQILNPFNTPLYVIDLEIIINNV